MIFLLEVAIVIGAIVAIAVAAGGRASGSAGVSPDEGVDVYDAGAQDARSVLRPVYLFLALGLSVAVTLSAAAQLLFYVLGRLLGVERPGGVGGSLALAMAGPASSLLVFGVSWLYHRRTIARQALAQPELPRQAGVRRLYLYLVALIALALFAGGAGGLLWTLADVLTNAPRTQPGSSEWWRESVSWYATLLAVGLPVWLLHWGPVARPVAPAAAEETASLARRLYVYLTLLAGVLSLLGAGSVAAKQLLDLALGEAATPAVITNLARSLAVAAVAGVAVFYHQRTLRADLRTQEARRESQVVAAAPPPALPGGLPGGPPAPERPYGVVYRRDGSEGSSWHATAADAEAARRRLSAGGVEWAALVRVESVETPPTAPAAPDAPAAPTPPTSSRS